MEINLDANKQSLPPWDLTVKHAGKKYPVKQPSGQQLVQLLELRKRSTSEGYAYLLKLFQDLTGIEDQLAPEDMLQFFTGLGVHIGKRVEKSKEAVGSALAAMSQAVADVKLN